MKKILFFAFISIMAFTGCTSKSKVVTINNIKLGIKVAETAKAKYQAFAEQARKENLPLIGKLFDAAAKAEEIHASNHRTALETYKTIFSDTAIVDAFTPVYTVKTTAENLQNAIEGTAYEVDYLFPFFLKDATSKKLKTETINSLTWNLEAARVHKELFNKALDLLKKDKENTLPKDYLVCPICGMTYDQAKVPDNCTICAASKDIFLLL